MDFESGPVETHLRCEALLCAKAAAGGNIELLQWMRHQNSPFFWDHQVYIEVAHRCESKYNVHKWDPDDVEVQECSLWAFDHGCPLPTPYEVTHFGYWDYYHLPWSAGRIIDTRRQFHTLLMATRVARLEAPVQDEASFESSHESLSTCTASFDSIDSLDCWPNPDVGLIIGPYTANGANKQTIRTRRAMFISF